METLDSALTKQEENNPYIVNAHLLYGLIKEFSVLDEAEDASTTLSKDVIKAFATELYEYIVKEKAPETNAGGNIRLWSLRLGLDLQRR